MRVSIDYRGRLEIFSEDHLEAFALSQWCKEIRKKDSSAKLLCHIKHGAQGEAIEELYFKQRGPLTGTKGESQGGP
jgi:hypothetical protein